MKSQPFSPNKLFHIFYAEKDFRTLKIEDTVEKLLFRICNLLTMKVPRNFKCQIRVVSSFDRLVSQLHSKKNIKGFYVPHSRVIYIKFDAFDGTPYVLAHEMVHALVTETILVPLPEKVQEILAGYVEYELRKENHA